MILMLSPKNFLFVKDKFFISKPSCEFHSHEHMNQEVIPACESELGIEQG